MTTQPDPSPSGLFQPTRWTLVLRSRGETEEARTALGELCEAYWNPVFRFLRREGRNDEMARELAQDFFARLLQGGRLNAADPVRGRFRSYLIGALKHFLAERRRHEQRLKRGGGQIVETLDEEGGSMDVSMAEPPVADLYFDRQWALAIMARALGTIEREMEASGKGAQCAVLKPWLVGEAASLDQGEAAARLGMTEGAVKVAIHRLRKRFREAVRTEIGQTVAEPGEIEEELRYLIEVLS